MTTRGRSRIISLGASVALVLTTVVIGTGPAAAEQDTASDGPTLASVGASPATETESGDVQDAEESITFDEVLQRVMELYFDGQVSRYGLTPLRFSLIFAERLYGDGQGCSHDVRRRYFFEYMERFRRAASNPDYVLTESARDELLAAADQLRQLCDAPEASG